MLSSKETLFVGPKIVDNNKMITQLKIGDLLKEKILIPNKQRIRDDMKVNQIIDYQEKYYKNKHNHFNFIGTINIHCCKENGKNYLVDGQHRFKAMQNLFTKHHYSNFNVKVEIVIVENQTELKENYNLINKNTELPEFPEEANKNVVENVCRFFFTEYESMWTLKKRQIRPYLNKNHFQEAVAYLSAKFSKSMNCNMDEEDLKEIIINKNKEMSSWTVEGYSKQIRKIKKWPEFLAICKENDFFIGMYNYTNEEYCYNWIRDIVEQYTGEKLKKEKRKRKKSIPKKKRQEVWTANNGESLSINCFCCNNQELNGMGAWECGHIISEANGGNLDTDNLKPICSGCNKSMGSKNMDDYMKEFYPKQYDIKFKKKKNIILSVLDYLNN